MKSRAFAGDRIVLFTLVDLLLQIIFCGFLLFAANRASQGGLQDKISKLVGIFEVDRVTRYVDATSKMISIRDLDRVHYTSSSGTSTPLDEATKMLGGLTLADVSSLAAMDPEQRRAFMKMYATLAPADRDVVSMFLNRYGAGAMNALLSGDLTEEQLRSFMDSVSRLPPGDRKKFVQLSATFAKADPAKRQKIVDQSAVITKPTCFGGKPALHITEIAGGYRITPLIPAIVPEVARAGQAGASVGRAFQLGESAFWHFGSAVTTQHPACYVKVRQDSQTYDERQLLRIQYWFSM
jgi:hypothetical protein